MNLTTARLAFWDAIDHFAPLKGKFKQTFRYVSARAETPFRPDGLQMPTSVAIDCPALRIRPASMSYEWRTGQLQKSPFALEWKIWASGMFADEIESLATLVVDAIHTSRAPGIPANGNGYIRAAISGGVPILSPVIFAEEWIGDEADDNGQPVLTATSVLTLPLNYQPVNYNVQ